MAVRELARRAGEHLRAVQLAVGRLVDAGIIERVGTGTQQQIRLNEQHPLSSALEQLFGAESTRFERCVNELKRLAKEHAGHATAIWLLECVSPDGSGLEVGLMAPSAEVDALTDALRESVAELARGEDVSIEVRGWTRPDLEALAWSPLSATGQPTLLWGVLPEAVVDAPSGVPRRSHAAADEALLERAKRAVVALERHPELVRKARDEVAKRLSTAPPQESKTLREWQDVLNGMRVPQLRKWLVGRSERATRLRQSMPLVLLQAADQQAASARGKP
ncbi:MAG TPA: hypothetical protein VGA22_04635 [Gemmatimonadales bacterium]|jgi:hypothetical protein